MNNETSSIASSAAMRLPMALAVTNSSSLARSKEPRRAAASKAWMAANGGSRTSLEGVGPRMIVWRAGRAPDERVATAHYKSEEGGGARRRRRRKL
ncbi:hypothetical protein HMPREF0004_0441 [Achromobacter piechaudii ATCC 43553]|uniref:Uncharacterized protein n=1 Tax=Achromobacter piechaudii ATCC 43553 TaxID=742159 RepID=D4X4P4_9BURK|nr:hypothetical protein HMPREF0004_0441 [Achromobacter piechaudii ATCC 43553]